MNLMCPNCRSTDIRRRTQLPRASSSTSVKYRCDCGEVYTAPFVLGIKTTQTTDEIELEKACTPQPITVEYLLGLPNRRVPLGLPKPSHSGGTVTYNIT